MGIHSLLYWEGGDLLTIVASLGSQDDLAELGTSH